MKKKWDRPSLTVIVRNYQQETVLGYCKLKAGDTGSNGKDGSCNLYITEGVCSPCSDLGASAS